MKKFIQTIAVIALITLGTTLMAQNPPHPNGGNDPTSGGNTPVGGAPIGGGLVMMMIMGAAYGTKKVYHLRKS
jgi:hypothetical protein